MTLTGSQKYNIKIAHDHIQHVATTDSAEGRAYLSAMNALREAMAMSDVCHLPNLNPETIKPYRFYFKVLSDGTEVIHFIENIYSPTECDTTAFGMAEDGNEEHGGHHLDGFRKELNTAEIIKSHPKTWAYICDHMQEIKEFEAELTK